VADSKTRLTPFDKLVAVVICDAINDKKQCWKMSDEEIAILIGKPGSERRIKTARKRLREGGWLTWTRTRDANVYRLRGDNVMAVLDEIMRQKSERKARRQRLQNGAGPYIAPAAS
jgi:DNA-binding transcriptional regulator PaaX